MVKKMENLFSVTEAKSKFSELINRVIYRKERIIVTKKGKKVAILIPLEDETKKEAAGLIIAQGSLTGLDNEIDKMTDNIYKQRKNEITREVNL
ncbi:MAG: hypothetical protein A2161_14190 [Candidatus Schekmanbacteria bacterium RBG_13_48_7]|uniref:Antitoxin n=1 Tax=Candidatus Schekmanbacteria bacterium RBG_13_48_7 TaxID=1817878 RepID=A0A1F7S053_9BACT|nr:MAG: hypothetical protein A2161_14190 [Candidatus Schekmanbacteria bacterium RBG_13_48_7]